MLDANISWRLVAKLKDHFSDCVHVESVGLSYPAKDAEIWNYAAVNGMIIVTNDDDFLNHASVKGFPPKVILLRTGNQTNQYIHDVLVRHKDDIVQLELSDEYGLRIKRNICGVSPQESRSSDPNTTGIS